MNEEEKMILLTRHNGEIKRHEGRIRDLERRQGDLDKLAGSLSAVAQKQADMDTDLKEIKKDVRILAEKPGRRWETVAEKLIAAVAGALAAYVLVQLGLG